MIMLVLEMIKSEKIIFKEGFRKFQSKVRLKIVPLVFEKLQSEFPEVLIEISQKLVAQF